MKRSPELKKSLFEDLLKEAREKRIPSGDQVKDFVRLKILHERDIVSTSHWSKEDWDRYLEDVQKETERNCKLLRIKEELLKRAIELSEVLENSSDEEFDQRFSDALQTLDDFDRVQMDGRRESFTLSFVDIVSVESFDQFIKGRWPMQFVPHKEEIGRILTVAKEMHAARVKKGEAQASDPIRIVDIGGSNGGLGKLVVDLARENSLEIHYITVDPDQAVIKAASEFYRDAPALEFIPKTIEEYTYNLYDNEPEVKALIDLRKLRIQEGEQKIEELEVYLKTIQSDYFKLNDENAEHEAIKKHCRVLRGDFGIDLNPDSFSNFKVFDNFFEDEYVYDEYGDEILEKISYTQKYRNRILQPEIEQLTEQIHGRLAQMTPTVDLAINSWMPPRMDLTSEIQFVNSAAICYALERGGATGCQSNVAFPEKPKRLGEGESYRLGRNYHSVFGWVSHSTPQLRLMSEYRSKDVPFTERMIDRSQDPRGVENIFPFSNAFVVQLRIGIQVENINPEHANVKIEGNYPWEQELDERGGAIQPVHSIIDKNGVPDLSPVIPIGKSQ